MFTHITTVIPSLTLVQTFVHRSISNRIFSSETLYKCLRKSWKTFTSLTLALAAFRTEMVTTGLFKLWGNVKKLEFTRKYLTDILTCGTSLRPWIWDVRSFQPYLLNVLHLMFKSAFVHSCYIDSRRSQAIINLPALCTRIYKLWSWR